MTERDKLQLEAFNAAKKANFDGILLLPTGAGKGKIMIDIVNFLKPKTILYLCDSVLLRDKMIIDEFHKWGAEYQLTIMDRVCYQTACKWKNKYYDLILGDEFDAALTPKRKNTFNEIKSKHKILVSATLDDVKRKMATKIAPIIFEKKPTELIENGVLNKVDFYFVNYDLSIAENIKYLNYNKEFKYLLNSIQTQKVKYSLEKLQIQRKQFLSSLTSSVKATQWIIKNLEKRKQKILIFCGLTEQANRICKHTYYADSEDQSMLQKFDSGHIMTLAVVNKVDRGMNINGVKYIIHESIGKSKTRMTQRTGRGMRLDVNETLSVFFLVPYFSHPFHGKRPTIVKQWVLDSTVDMDLSKVKTINYTFK